MKPAPVPQDSGEVDFSNVNTVDDVFSMAYKYMAALQFEKVGIFSRASSSAIKCYSKCIKMVGMKDKQKRKLMFNSRANAYLTMVICGVTLVTVRRTSTAPSATLPSASTSSRWIASAT